MMFHNWEVRKGVDGKLTIHRVVKGFVNICSGIVGRVLVKKLGHSFNIVSSFAAL